jgi:hypothetical protein
MPVGATKLRPETLSTLTAESRAATGAGVVGACPQALQKNAMRKYL